MRLYNNLATKEGVSDKTGEIKEIASSKEQGLSHNKTNEISRQNINGSSSKENPRAAHIWNQYYLNLDTELSPEINKEDLSVFQKGLKNTLTSTNGNSLVTKAESLIDKLENAKEEDLRYLIISLKQILQEESELIPEFLQKGGLGCLVKLGNTKNSRYQNYLLRTLGQIMLYVDGMNAVISHIDTIKWLYSLVGSILKTVVRSALKLLLVFIDYAESNSTHLITAIQHVESQKGDKSWSKIMKLLRKREVEYEIRNFAMLLINKTLISLPDQNVCWDNIEYLEELGMGKLIQNSIKSEDVDPYFLKLLYNYNAIYKFENGNSEDLCYLDENTRCSLLSRREKSYTKHFKRVIRNRITEDSSKDRFIIFYVGKVSDVTATVQNSDFACKCTGYS